MTQTRSLFECRRFAEAVSAAGGAVPQPLQALLDAVTRIEAYSATQTAVSGLIQQIAAGKLTSQKLTALVEAAAQSQMVASFVGGLRQAVEPEVVTRFHQALRDGAADEILDSLRPSFDRAAEAIADAKSALGSGESSLDHIVASSDKPDEVVKAWRALPQHLNVITAIAGIAAQFGCRPTAQFSLVAEFGLADNFKIDDRALAATTGWIVADSAMLAQSDRGGVTSPFYRCDGLWLHSISEMQARYAEFAAAEFDRIHGGPRGGFVGEDGQVHIDPVPPNPFRQQQEVSA